MNLCTINFVVINRLTIPVIIDSTTVFKNSTYKIKLYFERHQSVTLRYFKMWQFKKI